MEESIEVTLKLPQGVIYNFAVYLFGAFHNPDCTAEDCMEILDNICILRSKMTPEFNKEFSVLVKQFTSNKEAMMGKGAEFIQRYNDEFNDILNSDNDN